MDSKVSKKAKLLTNGSFNWLWFAVAGQKYSVLYYEGRPRCMLQDYLVSDSIDHARAFWQGTIVKISEEAPFSNPQEEVIQVPTSSQL